jgi:hypothetical protein
MLPKPMLRMVMGMVLAVTAAFGNASVAAEATRPRLALIFDASAGS